MRAKPVLVEYDAPLAFACLCTVGYAPLGGQEVWLLGLAKVTGFGFSTKEGFLQREI